MKQKRKLAALVAAGILLAGCGSGQKEEPVTYSNLAADCVRLDLDTLMDQAGIRSRDRAVLFDHVDQINSLLEQGELAEGFVPAGEPTYDPYEVRERWEKAYPDAFGYDCRITAFALLEDDFLEIPPDAEVYDDNMLLFDLAALEEDPSADIDPHGFRAFYSSVPTEMTKDVKVHARIWLESWKQRGIHIRDNPDVRLISVVFHGEREEESFLFVGHTGLLFPTPDGNFWFLEKLSFQEPYQVVQVSSRQQLVNYLMDRYDVEWDQPVAKPFLLENDRLINIS